MVYEIVLQSDNFFERYCVIKCQQIDRYRRKNIFFGLKGSQNVEI